MIATRNPNSVFKSFPLPVFLVWLALIAIGCAFGLLGCTAQDNPFFAGYPQYSPQTAPVYAPATAPQTAPAPAPAASQPTTPAPIAPAPVSSQTNPVATHTTPAAPGVGTQPANGQPIAVSWTLQPTGNPQTDAREVGAQVVEGIGTVGQGAAVIAFPGPVGMGLAALIGGFAWWAASRIRVSVKPSNPPATGAGGSGVGQ